VSGPTSRRIRILVVDDDAASRELLEELLASTGHDVETGADGEEGWARLNDAEAPPIDVALLDWRMPRMDGVTLLGKMKETRALESIPVILQTARADPEAMRDAVAAGASYFLRKPIDSELLATVVASAAEDHARLRELQENLRRGVEAAATLDLGVFHFRTIEQATALATLLSRACPDPDRTVVGLGELLVNAVEHGNLGITYEEKSALLAAQGWTAEVKRRLEAPEHRDKRVEVRFERTADRIIIDIVDRGHGFDWEGYMTISPERIFHSHGRGIAMANLMSFDRLEYVAPGNRVIAELELEPEPAPQLEPEPES